MTYEEAIESLIKKTNGKAQTEIRKMEELLKLKNKLETILDKGCWALLETRFGEDD